MDELFIEVKLTQDHVSCPAQSHAVLYLLQYLKADSFRLHLVQNQNLTACTSIPISAIQNLKPTVLDEGELPDKIRQCLLPSLCHAGDCLVRSGLGWTLRHIIKTVQNQQPQEQFITLLGHNGICLQACAESSVWTKYVEIELPSLLESELNKHRPTCPDELVIPNELRKLENHFHQPPIIHNINKRRKEWRKKKNNETSAGQRNNVNMGDQDEMNNLVGENRLSESDELQHNYVEGVDFTITDLVLFPTISFVFNHWSNKTAGIWQMLPKLSEWYRRMLQRRRVKDAACQLGLPLISLDMGVDNQTPLQSQTQDISDIDESQLLFKNIRVAKKKVHVNPKELDDILTLLEERSIMVQLGDHPGLEEMSLPWNQMPPAVHPAEGDLPASRIERKCQQLENLVAAVRTIARPGHTVVDFCSGGGHLGIILAHLLPDCRIILVENKEHSVRRAKDRIDKLQLNNVWLYQSNMDYFVGQFDVGVCLHACGVATDLVIQKCIEQGAGFVVCPCCYGGIRNTHTVSYPRSLAYMNSTIKYESYLTLGHAADQTQSNIPQAQQGKQCMLLIDTDRAYLAQEHDYTVTLCSLQPLTCSPKNNLLIATKL